MNILNVLVCFRVGLATYELSGEANYWWQFISRGRIIDTILWEEFEGMFYKRFFNETTKSNKVVEFMNLKQKNMTVVQYETQFNHMSRFLKKCGGLRLIQGCKFFDRIAR